MNKVPVCRPRGPRPLGSREGAPMQPYLKKKLEKGLSLPSYFSEGILSHPDLVNLLWPNDDYSHHLDPTQLQDFHQDSKCHRWALESLGPSCGHKLKKIVQNPASPPH